MKNIFKNNIIFTKIIIFYTINIFKQIFNTFFMVKSLLIGCYPKYVTEFGYVKDNINFNKNGGIDYDEFKVPLRYVFSKIIIEENELLKLKQEKTYFMSTTPYSTFGRTFNDYGKRVIGVSSIINNNKEQVENIYILGKFGKSSDIIDDLSYLLDYSSKKETANTNISVLSRNDILNMNSEINDLISFMPKIARDDCKNIDDSLLSIFSLYIPFDKLFSIDRMLNPWSDKIQARKSLNLLSRQHSKDYNDYLSNSVHYNPNNLDSIVNCGINSFDNIFK
jgi:hypothetical protein